MAASINIPAVLERLSKNQSEIRLLNIYKGLPISYTASIGSIVDSDLYLTSNKYQIACLFYQRESFIQSQELPFVIRGQVMSINLTTDQVAISNFETAQSSIGNRMNIRVEPDVEVLSNVQLKGYPTRVSAPLADLSIYGCSIYVDDFLFPVRLFQPGNEISIAISLPEMVIPRPKKIMTGPLVENRTPRVLSHNNMPVSADGKPEVVAYGKILAVRPELNLSRYRVSFKLLFKDMDRLVVAQYVSQRQAEIIRDLHILADELYKRKK